KQGHAAAQSKLGWMYQNGLGVQSDTNMAIYWYNKAAEQGYAEALRQLGMFYAYSSEPKEVKLALHLTHKAAEQGDDKAQHNLAEIYNDSRGE
ncbi:sel1 repeat family protein, partial [Escherichia coli]|nr:sel1 repeat family protein [Escherichia coli]